MPDAIRRLDVAVCSFRRPELLVALLPRLLEQAASVTTARCRVSVVDNDPEGSGLTAIEAAGLVSDDVHVVVEPTAGLASARNRALAEAEGASMLVFIDDDEIPEDGWLSALVATHDATGAAAVSGPVLSVLEPGTDPVVAASPLFSRPRRATGTRRPSAATNNLLLDMDVVREAGLRFDPRFSFTGGEDTFFTRSLVAAGGTIVWCDEAVVCESVPADRATPTWVRTRAQRNGETWAYVRVLDAHGARRSLVRAGLAARGMTLMALHSVRGLMARSDAERAAHRHQAAGGRGILRATTGRITQEYRR